MTPVQQAEERGHVMHRYPTVHDREQWVCSSCAATLLTDKKNPRGWGSSLDRDCVKRAAA